MPIKMTLNKGLIPIQVYTDDVDSASIDQLVKIKIRALLIYCVLIGIMTTSIAKGTTLATTFVDKTVPYPIGIKLDGAANYAGKKWHHPSPYFKHPDFYNMKSRGSLVILSHFKTYQQTTEYTCGPAAIVMAAYFRGKTLKELDVAAATGANETSGTFTEQMVNYLKSTGWKVRSSLTEPNIASLKFLKSQIIKGNPVLVEWVDWAGHWQVVIGYDDMGTINEEEDDVLIMADPYDTTDHLQDGYYIVPAERFLYMWFDHNLLPVGQRDKQWITFH